MLVALIAIAYVIFGLPKGISGLSPKKFNDVCKKYGAKKTEMVNDIKDALTSNTPEGVYLNATGDDIRTVTDAISSNGYLYDYAMEEVTAFVLTRDIGSAGEVKIVAMAASFNAGANVDQFYERIAQSNAGRAEQANNDRRTLENRSITLGNKKSSILMETLSDGRVACQLVYTYDDYAFVVIGSASSQADLKAKLLEIFGNMPITMPDGWAIGNSNSN